MHGPDVEGRALRHPVGAAGGAVLGPEGPVVVEGVRELLQRLCLFKVGVAAPVHDPIQIVAACSAYDCVILRFTGAWAFGDCQCYLESGRLITGVLDTAAGVGLLVRSLAAVRGTASPSLTLSHFSVRG